MSETARELLSLARNGSGGTVSLNGLPLPITGYFVGGRIPSLIMDVAEVESHGQHVATLQDLITFIARAGTPYIGAWRHGDEIHFDAVNWYAELSMACTVGRIRGELAIWEIHNAREIRLT